MSLRRIHRYVVLYYRTKLRLDVITTTTKTAKTTTTTAADGKTMRINPDRIIGFIVITLALASGVVLILISKTYEEKLDILWRRLVLFCFWSFCG